MLIDTLFTEWQRVAGIETHAEGLAPEETERLQGFLEALVQAPARARRKLSEAPDEDCAEVSWLLLHRLLRDRLRPEMAVGLLDWADLAREHSGLKYARGSVLGGHIQLCRGWALARADRDEARLAFETAETEYRDAGARPALQGLAVCAQGALDLRARVAPDEDEEDGAAGRFRAGLDRIRSDAGCDDVAAAAQAACDRALAQWQWADAVVTAAEPERAAEAPGSLLDAQLFDFLETRAIRAVTRDERPPAELFRLGQVVEAMAAQVGEPADFIQAVVGFLFHSKRLDRAEEFLRALLAKDPDDREAIEACASALHMQAKLDEAEELLRRSLERFPDDAGLHAVLATVLLEKGDHGGAAGAARRTLEIDPENPKARMVEQSLPKASVAMDGSTIVLGGDWNSLPREDLGTALTAAVLLSQPREEIEKALAEIAISDPGMAERVTAILRSKGVLEAPPEPEATLHLRRAEELFGQARFDEALVEYEAATRADPDLAYAYMGQGDVYYRTGRYFQAVAFFQESLALDPAAPTYRFMADSLRHIGKLASAREAYERALELNPEYRTARASLESLLAEMGETPTAGRPPAAAAGPGALPPVPRLVDPAPYHLFNLPEADFPDLKDLAQEEEEEGAEAASTPAAELPEARPEAGPRTNLSTDELIERIEEQSFPGLRTLLALGPLPEQLRWVEETYPPRTYPAMARVLQVPLFFLQNREKRLDEALRLALLIHGIAQLLPPEWPPDEDLSLGPARQRGDAAQALASVYLDRGELAQGLEYLHEAERWYGEDREERRRRGLSGPSLFDRLVAGGADPETGLFQQLAGVYASLGDEERARAYALRARQGEEPPPGPEPRFDDFMARARFSSDLGRYEVALALLDEAVPIATGADSLIHPRKLVSLCHATGLLMARMRLFRTALRYLGRALDINAARRRQSPMLADFLACGEIYEQRPDLGDAIASYEEALRCVSVEARDGERHVWRDASGAIYRVIDPDDAWTALLPLARVLEARGDLERAAGFLELALELGEQVRLEVARPEHRIGLQAHRVDAYEELARIEVRLAAERPGSAEEHLRRAWSVVERARGRAFVELLGSSRLALPSGVPAGLVEREATLRRRLDELSRQETGRVWDAYEATLGELETTWRDLVAASPQSADYVELRQGKPIGFEELRELLSMGEPS